MEMENSEETAIQSQWKLKGKYVSQNSQEILGVSHKIEDLTHFSLDFRRLHEPRIYLGYHLFIQDLLSTYSVLAILLGSGAKGQRVQNGWRTVSREEEEAVRLGR